jgi:hypothetical protein
MFDRTWRRGASLKGRNTMPASKFDSVVPSSAKVTVLGAAERREAEKLKLFISSQRVDEAFAEEL